MEDFVPFDLAVRLKEKGFKQKCLAYYDVEDNVGVLYNTQYTDEALPCQYSDLLQCHNTGEAETQSDDSGFCVDSPTISQVLKWLREEKEIDIILQPIFLYNENNREREYGIEIYAPQLNKSTHLDYFKKWEKGAVAGIDYVLDNLI